MRPIFPTLFILTMVAGCAPKYRGSQSLDRIAFRRQDSSFVNHAVDRLIQSGTPFYSLSWMGLHPREIIVTRGDSTSLYNAVGVYMTFLSDREFDACVPPSRASLLAWKALPSRAGIEDLYVFAAGDSAGMRDTFSVGSAECGGPMLTLHHPMLGIGPIVGAQWSGGAVSTGHGTLTMRVNTVPGNATCPAIALAGLESQAIVAECRMGWMQVSAATRVRPGRDGKASDTLTVSASVPALRIWMDCRGTRKSHSVCPPLPNTYALRGPAPPPNPVVELPPAPQTVTVNGVIKDDVEGVPIPYAWARFDQGGRVFADSIGRFAVTLPPSRPKVMAGCFMRGGSSEQGQAPVVVRPYMAELALFLNGKNCVRPPDPVQDSVFDGLYDVGIERSRFILCGNRTPTIWTELSGTAEADRDRLLALLKGKEDWKGFYWRVRGSLSGPGRFGKPATSDYLLRVERVVEIRPLEPGECYR